ncbi:DUF6351 family protein [Streptomyces sp. NPDC056486]|uniref:DUF6351 family protein n=1 Tax=Streptomyces sp. NPDC056486 TaxID=3345835 RepID=UPI0036CC0F88
MRSRLRRVVIFACAVMAATALTPEQMAAGADRPPPRIAIASTPDRALTSGGDALLRITTAGHQDPVRVKVNGNAVNGFQRQPDGTLLGLVTHLKNGRNRITAEADGLTSTRTVTNHRSTGPVFSGRQATPFYCETTAFGLAPARQPLCSAPSKVSYKYRSKLGAFLPLADPDQRPADLATATVGGRKVPYIVRIETGTINRAVYETAALYDGTDPTPLRHTKSWNGRLVYSFGGGCSGGHHQGAQTGGVLNDTFLSQGYAVASSTLNVLETNCSIPVSAEAAMMVKEHFVETYGPVKHTIGWGGSGGGIQQFTMADSYPGILDGIIPMAGFPDPFTIEKSVASDCKLLVRYFAGAKSSFTPKQRDAVTGLLDYGSCIGADQTLDIRTPAKRCDKSIPVTALWNATTNPSGVKCTLMEAYANQFGRDPKTGFVRSTLDNIGVQYGLKALNSKQISPAQFIALNSAIGGFDDKGAPAAQRSLADPRALKAAYRDDLLNSMRLGLRGTPIIDHRIHTDKEVPLDVHTAHWSYITRARLQAANGTSANQVIIESKLALSEQQTADAYVLKSMDRWLTNIAADGSSRGKQAKVIANKPNGLSDACYLTPSKRVHTPLTYPASGPCADKYPIGADPRLQAGEPLAETTLKCALQPLDFDDYRIRFTKTERAQLHKAFPKGVCDYTRPGPGQNERPRTWIDYSRR